MDITNLPTDYYCRTCGSRNVRLWKNYGKKDAIYCMQHSLENQKINRHVNHLGVIKLKKNQISYQIGCLYPAVLDQNNGYYPQDAILERDFKIWLELPVRPRSARLKPQLTLEQKLEISQQKLKEEIKKEQQRLAKVEERKSIFSPIQKEAINGTDIIKFRDKLGQNCVIRTSSTKPNCLLIGVDSTHLTKLIKAEIKEGELITYTPQMVLRIEDLESLIPVLIGFCATGTLEL